MYIKRGEAEGYDKRPTCSSRKNWYQIRDRKAFPILFSQMMGDRFMVIYNPSLAYVDHNFHEICSKNRIYQKVLAAILNSTVSSLFRELDSYLFTGSINITKMDTWSVERFLTLDVTGLSNKRIKRLEKSFDNISSRLLEHTLKELGASFPEEVSLDKVKLDLTEEEQLEIYRAVVDLVKSRIEKAKSFGKRKKTKEGIDIDALVNTVMGKVGDETIGKFYREKILTHKPLLTKMLPKASDKVKIEQHLFGWRLSSGKKYLECNSEEEARYLKVFLEAGTDKVKMPKDIEYLKSILPEMENLKIKITEVINSYLESIVDTKTKAKIAHNLWTEVLK
jgi:hypothetical protein